MTELPGDSTSLPDYVVSLRCPVSGDPGIPVPTAVLKSMLPRNRRGEAREGYALCTGSSCTVAYFDTNNQAQFLTSELNKPITLKDGGRDTLVCYCLQVSRGDILDSVTSRAVRSSEDAKRATRACTGSACHIVNPGGICCGDQLRDTVVQGLVSIHAPAATIAHARTEDPGATCCGRTLGKVLHGEADDGCCATSRAL